jgi:hypothetical protein
MHRRLQAILEAKGDLTRKQTGVLNTLSGDCTSGLLEAIIGITIVFTNIYHEDCNFSIHYNEGS